MNSSCSGSSPSLSRSRLTCTATVLVSAGRPHTARLISSTLATSPRRSIRKINSSSSRWVSCTSRPRTRVSYPRRSTSIGPATNTARPSQGPARALAMNGAIAAMSYGRAVTADAPHANASRARSSSPLAAPTSIGRSQRVRTAAAIAAASTVSVRAATTSTLGGSAPMATSASAPLRHHVVASPICSASSSNRHAIVGSASTSIRLRPGAPTVPSASSIELSCGIGDSAKSAEAPRDIVFGGLLTRIREHLLGVVDLDQAPRFAGGFQVEERGLVADAGRLLHVVGDDHDREIELELGDRVQRGAGLVHQQHVGLHGDGARDAQPLLLAARQPTAGLVEPVFDLVPQVGTLQ